MANYKKRERNLAMEAEDPGMEPTTMLPFSKAAAIQIGLEIPGMVKDIYEGIEIPEGYKKFFNERFGIKEK